MVEIDTAGGANVSRSERRDNRDSTRANCVCVYVEGRKMIFLVE